MQLALGGGKCCDAAVKQKSVGGHGLWSVPTGWCPSIRKYPMKIRVMGVCMMMVTVEIRVRLIGTGGRAGQLATRGTRGIILLDFVNPG